MLRAASSPPPQNASPTLNNGNANGGSRKQGSGNLHGQLRWFITLSFVLVCGLHWRLILSHAEWEDDDAPASMASSAASPGMSRSRTTYTTARQLQQDSHPVFFLREGQVQRVDMYAGAWYQSTLRFLNPDKSRLDAIANLEHATHAIMAPRYHNEVRMTLDWLDFSVEHLSKWWNAAGMFQDAADQVPIRTLSTKLRNYISKSQKPPTATEETANTIAVLPFMAWKNGDLKDRARELSVVVLGATIASMVRLGFVGRLVVAISDINDIPIVQDVCEVLGSSMVRYSPPPQGDSSQRQQQQGDAIMQVTTVQIDLVPPHDKPCFLPKLALLGLRSAFNTTATTPTQQAQWLGTTFPPSHWQYVYFTEADVILNARLSAVARIQQSLQKEDTVFIPHRITAVPHEADLTGLQKRFRHIPLTDGGAIVSLDASRGDRCCDGGNQRPGLPPRHNKCGNFWYLCDFGDPEIFPDQGHHERILEYGFLRIGTQIINFAGSEWGRQCRPRKAKEGPCPTDHLDAPRQ